MKATLKLVIVSAVFSLVVFCVFFIAKPQIILASACISNATQRCVGYSVFWYDSCGQQQDWIKNCSYKCQNGQCISNQPTYVKHYRKSCSNNNLYWYDSNGAPNDIYKNCSDNNELTQDSCLNNQCVNETIVPNNCNTQVVPSIGGIDTSIFCGIQDNSINLSKNVTIAADQTIDCLIIVKNTSTTSINDVVLRADIPGEIVSISEVKIDGMAFNGNITSGINIGSFSPNVSKIITFTGKTLSPITQALTKQITGITSSGDLSSSDSLTINFQPTVAGASTASLESSPFVEFFKHWYIWILIAIVLVFLFFVIFRRLSSND